MPKICVIEVSNYCNSCGAEDICNYREGTNWEEVSEEEYNKLIEYAKLTNKESHRTNKYVYIVKQIPVDLWKTNIQEIINKANEAIKREVEKENKKKIAEEKRQKELAKKKEKKDRELLEKLKNKYE